MALGLEPWRSAWEQALLAQRRTTRPALLFLLLGLYRRDLQGKPGVWSFPEGSPTLLR